MSALIKRADKASAFLEATRLAGFTDREAARLFSRARGLSGGAGSALFSLKPVSVKKAQNTFMRRFRLLQ